MSLWGQDTATARRSRACHWFARLAGLPDGASLALVPVADADYSRRDNVKVGPKGGGSDYGAPVGNPPPRSAMLQVQAATHLVRNGPEA